MNFIAAFLLANYQDEETTFQLFNILMSDYSGLQLKNFEKLKELQYIFDRLVNIFH